MNNNLTTIYIDSKDRINGTRNSFNVKLPKHINHIVKSEIGDIILPLIIYNITSTDNKFNFTDSTSSAFSITVPPGSYSASQISTYIQNEMNNLSSDVYSVSYNTIFFKFYITTPTGAFSINTVANNIYNKLNITVGSSVVDGSDNVIIGNIVVFGLPYYLYIKSRALCLHGFDHHRSYNSDPLMNNRHILSKVSLNGNTGSIIYASFINNILSAAGVEQGEGLNLGQIIDVEIIFPDGQQYDIMDDWSMSIHIEYKDIKT